MTLCLLSALLSIRMKQSGFLKQEKILTEPNDADFTVLMEAVITRNIDIVKSVIGLYKEAFED